MYVLLTVLLLDRHILFEHSERWWWWTRMSETLSHQARSTATDSGLSKSSRDTLYLPVRRNAAELLTISWSSRKNSRCYLKRLKSYRVDARPQTDTGEKWKHHHLRYATFVRMAQGEEVWYAGTTSMTSFFSRVCTACIADAQCWCGNSVRLSVTLRYRVETA